MLETLKAELDQRLLYQKVEGLKKLMKELGYSELVIADCNRENVKEYALSLFHNIAKKIITVNIDTFEITKHEKIETLCREAGKLLHKLGLIPERYNKLIDNVIAGSIEGINEIKARRQR